MVLMSASREQHVMAAIVIDVTARCITRKQGTTDTPKKAAKVVRGYVVALPRVGASLVIFHRDGPGRMITSAVVRVLSDTDGTLYVETLNSIYRMTLTH